MQALLSILAVAALTVPKSLTATSEERVAYNVHSYSGSGSFTLSGTDEFVKAAPSGGNITLVLPAASSGRLLVVTKSDTSSNTVSISPPTGVLINGSSAAKVLRLPYESITLISDGGEWYVPTQVRDDIKIGVGTIAVNSGTYSVASQAGNWISSVTKNGTGDISINFASGVFGSFPYCVATSANSNVTVMMNSSSTSAVNFRMFTGSTGTLTDSYLIVNCTGPRG